MGWPEIDAERGGEQKSSQKYPIGFKFFSKDDKCTLEVLNYNTEIKMYICSDEDRSDRLWLSECTIDTCVQVSAKITEHNNVHKPSHYQVFPEHNLEVKDILKRILDNIEKSSFDMTLDEAGWWQQAMQYFMRFAEKNGIEDLKKGQYAMDIVIKSMEQRSS